MLGIWEVPDLSLHLFSGGEGGSKLTCACFCHPQGNVVLSVLPFACLAPCHLTAAMSRELKRWILDNSKMELLTNLNLLNPKLKTLKDNNP